MKQQQYPQQQQQYQQQQQPPQYQQYPQQYPQQQHHVTVVHTQPRRASVNFVVQLAVLAPISVALLVGAYFASMYCLIWVIGITFYTHFLIRYTSAASEAPMLLKTWLVVGYAVVVAACATAIVSLQNFFQCVSDGDVDPSDSECKRALRFFYVSCGLYGLVYAVDFLLALSHLLKRRAVNAGGYSQV